MTALRFDRFPRLTEPPAFLAVLGPKDRMLWRVALAPVLVVVAVVAVGIVAQPLGDALTGALAEAAGRACPADGGLVCAGLATLHDAPWYLAASLAVLLVLALIMGRRPLTWISGAGRPRWRMLLLGLVGAALALAPFDWAARGLPELAAVPPLAQPSSAAVKGGYVLACVLGLGAWALFEELLFRGWLLQQFAALTRNLVVVLAAQALVFTLFHAQSDLGANIGHAVFGLVLGYAALRLGGLEFAVGAHAANNLLIALFLETVLEGQAAPASNWAASALDVAGSLAILAVVEIVARVPALAAWAGVSPSAAAGPAPSEPEAPLEDHP